MPVGLARSLVRLQRGSHLAEHGQLLRRRRVLRRRPGGLGLLRALQAAQLLVEAKSVDAEVERNRGAARAVLLDDEYGEGQGRGVD